MNTNRCPENGSCCNLLWTKMQSPSNERRISVAFVARNTRTGGAKVNIAVPDVGNVVVAQVSVNTLADPYQAVLLPAGQPEQFELGLRGGGVGDELLGRLGVGRGREGADPGERVEVRQSKVEGLAAAHRQAGQGAVLAVRFSRVARLDRWDHVA